VIDALTKAKKQALKMQAMERIIRFIKFKISGLKVRVVWFETSRGRVRTLWYGDSPKPQPLFVDLHGGGFVLGGPEMDHKMNVSIAKGANCKVVSIDYPKAPKSPYPFALEAVIEVVQAIARNFQTYGIDPEKIGIGGHSAGANLSTAICLKPEGRALRFRFQILDYPPLDLFTTPYEKPQPKGCIPPEMATMFNLCYVNDHQAKEIYASPAKAEPSDLKNLPPALVILAGIDSLFDEGMAYSNMLRDSGVSVECLQFPESKHGFTVEDSTATTEATKAMVDFVRRKFEET
jgi:acetyl esterase